MPQQKVHILHYRDIFGAPAGGQKKAFFLTFFFNFFSEKKHFQKTRDTFFTSARVGGVPPTAPQHFTRPTHPGENGTSGRANRASQLTPIFGRSRSSARKSRRPATSRARSIQLCSGQDLRPMFGRLAEMGMVRAPAGRTSVPDTISGGNVWALWAHLREVFFGGIFLAQFFDRFSGPKKMRRVGGAFSGSALIGRILHAPHAPARCM